MGLVDDSKFYIFAPPLERKLLDPKDPRIICQEEVESNGQCWTKKYFNTCFIEAGPLAQTVRAPDS